MKQTAEHKRLQAHRNRTANWKNWGPYLSERAWGTVREDYSGAGEAWNFFPHDHARSRTFRWNEDGLMGISDRYQYFCFALALWNGKDPILKERLFGLTGVEGNHAEDVKEYYYYLDSTPTHSYMKMLYKYPQAAFPYADLVNVNQQRGYQDFEYELMDTGVFDDNRYFDVVMSYAKADQNDILIQIEISNRGPESAPISVLPTLWFRNTWSWGYEAGPMGDVPGKPLMTVTPENAIRADHPAEQGGRYYLYADEAHELLFTENETNEARLFGTENETPYVKDAFHNYVVHGDKDTVNPDQTGTKAAALYNVTVPAGETVTLRLRLVQAQDAEAKPFADFNQTFAARKEEADEFYAVVQKDDLSDDEKNIQRQAFAGMMWTKQLYYYDIVQWLDGDPISTPPDSRMHGRNHNWAHLNNFDIISMPDKWEYPWYAGWDLAFHCVPLAMIDPDFAKRQLQVLTREWYMHPNGQLPAYEWAFGDVNPPVHAWGTRLIYEIDAEMNGTPDRAFLEEIFQKLLINFAWWVNRKDADGNNIFQGGFLGLDNISVFDRSKPLPTGGHIDQSDGTAWMAFFALEMLNMAIELSKENPVYESLATRFFEHFLRIAHAMAGLGDRSDGLWDREDGFYYDALHIDGQPSQPIRVRSLVGLMPMIAVETIGKGTLDRMPDFARRMDWMLNNRPYLAGEMADAHVPGVNDHKLLSIFSEDGLKQVLRYMLDETEFLSDYGIRSVSKYHEANPYEYYTENGQLFSVAYWPAESQSGLFGGNSNWRGPIWFPINFLLIESLRKFYRYSGDSLQVEMPTGSGSMANMEEVADEISRRLCKLFLRDANGKRPIYGGERKLQDDPHWRDLILFHEYFHGDNGAGLGASHQTGWTGLVAYLLQQVGGKK